MCWQWFSKVENKVQNGFFQNQETLETPYPENVFERPNKETPKETKRGEENNEYPPEIAEDTEEREGMTPKNRTNPKQPPSPRDMYKPGLYEPSPAPPSGSTAIWEGAGRQKPMGYSARNTHPDRARSSPGATTDPSPRCRSPNRGEEGGPPAPGHGRRGSPLVGSTSGKFFREPRHLFQERFCSGHGSESSQSENEYPSRNFSRTRECAPKPHRRTRTPNTQSIFADSEGEVEHSEPTRPIFACFAPNFAGASTRISMVNTQHPMGQGNAAPEMVVAIHNPNPEPTPPNFILVESRATQKRKEKRKSEQKNIFEEDGETTEEESETESKTESEKEKILALPAPAPFSDYPAPRDVETRREVGEGASRFSNPTRIYVSSSGDPPAQTFELGG